jgi:hypothetical protein
VGEKHHVVDEMQDRRGDVRDEQRQKKSRHWFNHRSKVAPPFPSRKHHSYRHERILRNILGIRLPFQQTARNGDSIAHVARSQPFQPAEVAASERLDGCRLAVQ